MYTDYALIKKSTLKDIADGIRTKKGTSGLIPPQNMKGEILSISSGGTSVADGYTVNFYDMENNLIESHSAKVGNQIGMPLFSVEMGIWLDENGDTVSFPISENESTELDFYFKEYEFVKDFYNYFGIDSSVYPYLYIVSWYANTSTWRTKAFFAKSIANNGGALFECLVISSNGYDKAITEDEYNNTAYYSNPFTIFETLKEAGVEFNEYLSSYTTDNDTYKCWYFTNYETSLHTNWTDLRKL